MPQPRKPAAVQEASGAWRKNPSRRRIEPKVTGPLGPAPRYFSADQKKIWRELADMAPLDVLANADRWCCELACSLMDRLRSGKLSVAQGAQLVSLLSRLGLTPADRSRVAPAGSQTKSPDANEFAEFA
jgi:phage terminase small subunit